MGETVKARHKKFSEVIGVGAVFASDCGYNDFHYISAFKKYRVLDTSCIHFVVGGKGELYIDDRRYEVSAGQMFVMLKGENVVYYPNEADPWRYFWMNIRGDEAERYMSLMGFTEEAPVRDIADPERKERELTELFSPELSQSAAYYKAISLFFATVSECCGEVKEDSFIKDSGIVERAKEIIHLNYSNPDFSVGMLGDIIHVSHSYICKLFKKKTAVTAANYLLNYRLSMAAELAAGHLSSVKDISLACGFSDELYFMKKFKERYGVTVKEYMRRNMPGE